MKKRILLVEDETYIQDLYRYSLTGAGYEVTTAVDGIQAFEIAKQMMSASQVIDLILLDIMLPKLNGIEVLKSLKSEPSTKAVPVVLISNLGAEDVIRQAFGLGATGYLLKANMTPFQIIDQVKKFIEDPNYKTNLQGIDFD